MDTMTGYPATNETHPMNKYLSLIFVTNFTDKKVVKASNVLHATIP